VQQIKNGTFWFVTFSFEGNNLNVELHASKYILIFGIDIVCFLGK
jgi:hypothetical protein